MIKFTRTKSNLQSGVQAFAGAFLLALMIVSSLGITRAHAAVAASNAPVMSSHGDSDLCAAELQSSDYYLRQEEAVLRQVSQINGNAVQMALLSSSNACAAGMNSSDYYLRQEEAILSRVIQSNWNVSELALLGGSYSPAAGMHSGDYYLLQEQAVLRIVTQSNGNAAEIASFNVDKFIAQASR